jgi:hypothetical protein
MENSVKFYVVAKKTAELTQLLQIDIPTEQFPILVILELVTKHYTYITFEEFMRISENMMYASFANIAENN